MSDHAEGSVSDEDYEVEGIVGHKDSSINGRQYEVKWKGYKETTFEPRENLVPNSEDLIVEYDKKHPLKKLKVSTRSRSKLTKEGKSQKSEVNTILDSPSGDDSTDSNIDNKKNYVEAKRKRKLSKRIKTKIKRHKKNRKKESARAKKVVKTSSLRNRKEGRKKRSSRLVIKKSSVKSSSDEEYEVELLLKHRDLEDGRMYLVKWKGYRKTEATWEPSTNLSCRTLVRQYEHLKGKWKISRKRASGSSDKQPTKRMRTAKLSDNSNHETKEEEVVKKQGRRRLVKRKDGTWSNEREDDGAEKEEATAHTDGDEKETNAGEKNKKEDLPKGGKHKKVSKGDVNLDIPGEEKSEDKGETKDEVEKTRLPDGEKGSQDDSGKTKDNSPQGKKDKSPEGKKREEEKQVDDNNKE